MKKLFSLAFGLLLAASTQAAVGFDSESFINGQYMYVTNNSTTVYGATNVQVVSTSGDRLFYSVANSSIPVTLVSGVSYYTNTLVSNTNVVNAAAWKDVDAFADRNGNVGAMNITVIASLESLAATNAVTFTFQRVPDGTNPETVSSAANPLVFVFAVTGNTNNVFSTNLVSAFSTANAKIRLKTIVTANSSTNAAVLIRGISLNGFRQ